MGYNPPLYPYDRYSLCKLFFPKFWRATTAEMALLEQATPTLIIRERMNQISMKLYRTDCLIEAILEYGIPVLLVVILQVICFLIL